MIVVDPTSPIYFGAARLVENVIIFKYSNTNR